MKFKKVTRRVIGDLGGNVDGQNLPQNELSQRCRVVDFEEQYYHHAH